MRRTPAQRRGADAEDRALAHLRSAGLDLVERNWRCRLGEIDLIMRDGADLVFVEVRMRSARARSSFASAAETVGPRKQARLLRAAQTYLSTLRDPPRCRFDVVAFDEARDGHTSLAWLRNAFQAD